MGFGLGCGDGITGIYDLLKGNPFHLFFSTVVFPILLAGIG
jgi:hypothetical protein